MENKIIVLLIYVGLSLVSYLVLIVFAFLKNRLLKSKVLKTIPLLTNLILEAEKLYGSGMGFRKLSFVLDSLGLKNSSIVKKINNIVNILNSQHLLNGRKDVDITNNLIQEGIKKEFN